MTRDVRNRGRFPMGWRSTSAFPLKCALAIHLVSLLGCAGATSTTARPASAAREIRTPAQEAGARGVQHGQASYYSDKLAGRRTANGERYDPRALTAAHRKLRFGTIVEVTRVDGRRVQVRINDRGPFGNSGRIIDVSRAAAEKLEMVRDGVTEVTVRVIRTP